MEAPADIPSHEWANQGGRRTAPIQVADDSEAIDRAREAGLGR
jgi:hypothetical protein